MLSKTIRYNTTIIVANKNKKKEFDLLMHEFESVAKPCQMI
jgi:hypothetical protein